jgi:hypothetical protein
MEQLPYVIPAELIESVDWSLAPPVLRVIGEEVDRERNAPAVFANFMSRGRSFNNFLD